MLNQNHRMVRFHKEMEVEPQLNTMSGMSSLSLGDVQKYINNDICKLVEALFRIRDNAGNLKDYKIVEPHRKLLTTGLLGDRSKLLRIINKGRQAGFSSFLGIETLMIASLYPNSYQYYIATKEDQARSWLEQKVRQAVKDARLSPFDGSRFIDLDDKRTSVLQIAIKHMPKEFKKEVENSYIVGLAASPEGARGPTALNLILDEFPNMRQRKDLQRKLYNAVRYFISQTGSQMTIEGTPIAKSDEFWKMYTHAEEMMLAAFDFPLIENWRELDLTKDLRTQKCVIPYYWTDINTLEQARREDLDSFKQECLGIPFEAAEFFIPKELLDQRIISTEKTYNDDNGIYMIAIDFAQKRDLTAITVGQAINGIIWERCIVETQARYDADERVDISQMKLIKDLCKKFRPIEIVIDNTGLGVPMGDMIEKERGMPRLRRVDFASYIEEEKRKERVPKYLATEFKRALIEEKYNLIPHHTAEAHVLRLEKLVSSDGAERFTGKRGGTRDDHFWSKALLWHGFNYNGNVKHEAFFAGNSNPYASRNAKKIEGINKLKRLGGGGFIMW